MQIRHNSANVNQTSNNFAGQGPVDSPDADLAYPILSHCYGGSPTIRLDDDPLNMRQSIAQNPGAVSTRRTFAYAQRANG
jgi:hypothetical protein